ncbi:MAG TPA: phosphatase PAP2 family protein [Chloroflexota bacterium]|nr:phosphatase PAP2 family protein [Chloroflexota bacterium]
MTTATSALVRRMAPRRLGWRRVVVGALALTLLVPNSSVLEHRAIVAVFLGALAVGRGRRFVADWLPLIAAAAVFVTLRQVAALSPLPHQGPAVARLESALFGGTLPSEAVQSLRAQPVAATLLDAVATAIHASYFLGFVAVGLAVWVTARAHFRAYARAIALTFALGLGGYVVFPTEPPWLVAREAGGPAVERVIVGTTRGAPVAATMIELGRRWQPDPDALGDPNPSAAMPSVHTAITAALALFLFRLRRAAGVAGLVYTAAMGLSLVYLGEHFVLDVLAGIACAAAATSSWRSWRWPSRRSWTWSWTRSSPRLWQWSPAEGARAHARDTRSRAGP